jgi:hypothetical protein
MAQTTQDFVKGIDITGLDEVTGSQINQSVDLARPASNKGLTIATTDTEANIPDVPNPDVEYEGVTPTHWKRYIWVRKPFNDTYKGKLYYWNDAKVSDATYLKWEEVSFDDTNYVTDAELAAVETLANDAQAAADSAQSTANTAQAAAINAQTTANNAAASIPGEVATQIAGATIDFSQIIATEIDYTKSKLFTTPIEVLATQYNAAAFAVTAFSHVSLAAHQASAGLGTYSSPNLAAILRIQLMAGFLGAGANNGICQLDLADNGSGISLHTFSVDIIRTSPNDTRQKLTIEAVVPMSALYGFYWRWQSTATENHVRIHLIGFHAGMQSR